MSQRENDEMIIPTMCYTCYNGCGVLAHVDQNGKIVKIKGNPDHPVNRGAICPKTVYVLEEFYRPTRLLYPLKRDGEKGEGKWKRISWDEAYDIVIEGIQKVREKYGPLAFCAGVGTPNRTHGMAVSQFTRMLGSPNITTEWSWCEGPGEIGDCLTIGEHITKYRMGPDLRNTQCFFVMGCNLDVTHNPKWVSQWPEAKSKGAKLIVVDPRHTRPAKNADLYLQIKPGTDGALLLGMLNVIINEELYDKDFVNKWCIGFEELRERVQKYPLEKVEKITWVSKEKIQQAARMFATIKPSSGHRGCGIQQYTNAFQTGRAFIIMLAICGCLDVKGGNLLIKQCPGYKTNDSLRRDLERYGPPREVEAKVLGTREFPLWSGPDSFLHVSHNPAVLDAMIHEDPYPIKAWYMTGINPLLTYHDSEKVLKALKKLEFVVVSEYSVTPTGEYADVLLPKRHWLENTDVHNSLLEHCLSVAQPVVEPLGETKDELEIMIELSKRMEQKGYIKSDDKKRYLPWNNIKEFVDWRIKDTGITYEELKEKGFHPYPIDYKEYEKRPFKTPSGKVELYSETLEKFGYDPLPNYREPFESDTRTPELAEKYPLMLDTGVREKAYEHSRYRDCPSLRKLSPDPWVQIHPQTAKARGISDGDWLWIENTRGKRIKMKAKVTLDIHPKVIATPYGWWFPEKPAPEHGCFESNPNVLTPSDPPYDPVTGTSQLKGLLCEVEKI